VLHEEIQHQLVDMLNFIKAGGNRIVSFQKGRYR
jgi:hypothetical protein